MSSSGVTVAEGGPQMFFCHQCERTVNITPSPAGDILCPSCNSGFVEEFQNPNPTPAPDPFLSDPLSLFLSQFLPSATTANPSPLSRPPTAAPESSLGQDAFDPVLYLMNLLANRRASGIDYQFVFDDHPSPASGFPLSTNLGDYFMGPGFEQLIQQLSENDPNRYGTPPASKSAVQALPSVTVDEGMLKSDLAQCAVCKDDLELGTVVKQMPCKHVYHDDCILPWLELHNSCPVCRYELPTDDADYESRNGASRGSSGGDGDAAGGSDGQRTVERRMTISFPWLFGGSDSGREGGGRNNQWQS
ncbi:hypothetical protein SASPL_130657 [Salvia splendens]|uniref:RING-type E3 ubiquitin transferase n=1 Tax=Salvia splendens TaxID=180675 RepID=A0A8X8X8L3_SALSN|nr:E3 ubiquitin-protein ligase RING1-like [Salvia splendens]KAG6407660.1 hypothetical protein SASPL_130657 [Salvia splendens]